MFCVLAVPGRERVGAAAAGPAEAPGSLRLLLRPSLSRAFSSFSALQSSEVSGGGGRGRREEAEGGGRREEGEGSVGRGQRRGEG
eukprot:3912089-Rhodomonas_salina.2